MSGVLTINNNNSVSGVAQFDPINLADKSETKNYRMDFILSMDASKITIKGMENMFTKQIVFEIVAGKIVLDYFKPFAQTGSKELKLFCPARTDIVVRLN